MAELFVRMVNDETGAAAVLPAAVAAVYEARGFTRVGDPASRQELEDAETIAAMERAAAERAAAKARVEVTALGAHEREFLPAGDATAHEKSHGAARTRRPRAEQIAAADEADSTEGNPDA